MEKKKSNKAIFLAFYRMTRELFKTIPWQMAFYCVMDVFHALSIVLSVYGMKLLVDAVENFLNGNKIFTSLFLFILFSVFNEICNGLGNFHFEYLSPKMIIHLKERLHHKISSFSVVSFEDPEILDMIDKAKEGIEPGLETTFLVISTFTLYLPYYIFMGMYLKDLSPILLLIILLIFVPVIFGWFLRFKIFRSIEDAAAPCRRKMSYYESAICDVSTFKETRLLGAYKYFFDQYKEMKSKLNTELFNAEIRYARKDFILQLITTSGYIGIIVLLANEMLLRNISAGAFASVFTGLSMMYSLANEVFVGTFRRVSRNAASLLNYWSMIDYEYEKKQENEKENFDPQDLSNKISMKNVSFNYPDQRVYAISGITLDISMNQTIAIVGENGAGKSTLVKLIIGLLQPTDGFVYIDGININEKECDDKFRNISAVFQNYQCYQMSLRDNICISDFVDNDYREERINNVMDYVGLDMDVKTFPQGKSTVLSRKFGGVDLSGGQWQRIATARGLYRNHDIIVLDEPTSAIDPIEESRIYKQFIEITNNKTGIIVTHRLGAARIANQIILMKNGRIEGVGTHEKLMKENGYYRKMFNKQAQWYIS